MTSCPKGMPKQPKEMAANTRGSETCSKLLLFAKGPLAVWGGDA